MKHFFTEQVEQRAGTLDILRGATGNDAERLRLGAVGTAALGIYLFAEPATVARLLCIGLILSGIVGLKLVT